MPLIRNETDFIFNDDGDKEPDGRSIAKEIEVNAIWGTGGVAINIDKIWGTNGTAIEIEGIWGTNGTAIDLDLG